MLACCTALGLRTGWLIYAKGSSPPGRRRVRNSDIDIVHHPLDLSAPPHALLCDIGEAAGRAVADLHVPIARTE